MGPIRCLVVEYDGMSYSLKHQLSKELDITLCKRKPKHEKRFRIISLLCHVFGLIDSSRSTKGQTRLSRDWSRFSFLVGAS